MEIGEEKRILGVRLNWGGEPTVLLPLDLCRLYGFLRPRDPARDEK